MKTIATLIFFLFIAVASQAQTAQGEAKVETVETTIVSEITLNETTKVARLYKRSNSKVKKALSFTTKRDSAKMA